MDDFNLDVAIRKLPDFPKPGVLFYDITSIFLNVDAFSFCIDKMCELYKDAKIDGIVGLDARGFLFAAPLANRLQKPLILARKKGKLPGKTFSSSYTLEYGESCIEIQKSDISEGCRYLVVDDLVATGGTFKATADILKQGKATIYEFFAVIGLSEFPYEKILSPHRVKTLIKY